MTAEAYEATVTDFYMPKTKAERWPHMWQHRNQQSAVGDAIAASV
jgi:hypothetical protein